MNDLTVRDIDDLLQAQRRVEEIHTMGNSGVVAGGAKESYSNPRSCWLALHILCGGEILMGKSKTELAPKEPSYKEARYQFSEKIT